ncbi:hypothetical protein QZJ86_12085 [Methylomonas montana]|uniref:hypothetical protein n=1 Tax=Methylomonas montana TaxID=3058963 RepID=UPI0026596257|nr:hypothetical protein [Methylomonas montana]WKJ88761.1 hypothetical protein QZJ86_12085 [Methylomonas montana]
MASEKYRVLETSYIHDRLVQPGDEVDWDEKVHGTAGPNLEPVNPKKKRPAAVKTEEPSKPEEPGGDDSHDNGDIANADAVD